MNEPDDTRAALSEQLAKTLNESFGMTYIDPNSRPMNILVDFVDRYSSERAVDTAIDEMEKFLVVKKGMDWTAFVKVYAEGRIAALKAQKDALTPQSERRAVDMNNNKKITGLSLAVTIPVIKDIIS